ncbi:MAG TPA: hypothetical protein VFI39_09890 [Gemmatimonadales bacterium]|nr:hypothetical protein [Gemmatimonadales bacterium]
MRAARAIWPLIAVSAAVVLLAAARSTRPSPTRELVVTARDYAFEAPDSVPAGLTEIREHNLGPSLHHISMYRLAAGKSMVDFMGALKPGAPIPEWAAAIGGPNSPVPGGWSNSTVVLTPAHYVLICFISDSAGHPHFAMGMERELVVTGATKAMLPKAGRTVDLSDYAFGVPATVPAGKQVWRFTNSSAQPHEALLVQLAPGKRAADVTAWVDAGMHGQPPAMPLGGISPLAPGGSSEVAFELAPGSYALLCFLPDAKDGQDHWKHGMVKAFEVK